MGNMTLTLVSTGGSQTRTRNRREEFRASGVEEEEPNGAGQGDRTDKNAAHEVGGVTD